jgi:putative flippase GtrA
MRPDVKAIVIIPAYQPNEALVSIVKALQEDKSDRPIMVIDDGSGTRFQAIFKEVSALGVRLLTHAENKGKGAALQTAFKAVMNEAKYAECCGVVTADADGQHLPKDILRLCRALEKKPHRFYLGARDVGGAKVPLRSRFGNILTRFIFNCLSKQPVSDTQSGLRGIPRSFLPHCMNASLTGYEFELEMLLKVTEENVPLKVMSIQTVYEPGNPTSHFNPLVDSVKIYYVFLRFVAVAIASAAIDFSLFFLMFYLSGRNILAAVIFGRVISGAFNFFLNKKISFQSHGSTAKSGIKYTLLAVFLATCAYLMIKLIHGLHFNIFYAKLFGEALLFLVSFLFQRYFIFNH